MGHIHTSNITVTGLIRTFADYATLRASLESIQGVFDEIIVLYHDSDTATKEILLEVQELYRLRLIPYNPPIHISPSDTDKTKHHDYIQFLADYAEFGRQQVSTKYFVNIDTDQIYFTEELKKAVGYVKKYDKRVILSGFNLYYKDNTYCIDTQNPINGKWGDALIVKTQDVYFSPGKSYEVKIFKDRFGGEKNFLRNDFLYGHIGNNFDVQIDLLRGKHSLQLILSRIFLSQYLFSHTILKRNTIKNVCKSLLDY